MANIVHRPLDEQFLILAPTGRDGPLTCSLLAQHSIASRVCRDVDELCTCMDQAGAAGLMLAQEALDERSLQRLSEQLCAQPSWSDIPVLLFTAPRTEPPVRGSPERLVERLGNVTLLERPLRPITMLSAANSALRARRRQYLARAELKAEQLAVRQRDQFLAMLGHELRNPLSAIALANDLNGAGTGARHDVIGRQVKHLMRLVDDLLDVARVTSGKIVLKCEPLDLRASVEAALASAASMIAEHRVELRVNMSASAPLWVHGDPVRLEQVIVNLLSNAAKYTSPQGRIELSLRAERDQAVLEIRDDGVGIPPEMLERVFELFTQVEGSLDRTQGGLGIGLTLVRTLIELHGGGVYARSKGLGAGATFGIRLPLMAAECSRRSFPLPEARQEDSMSRSYQVLVVEDNPDNRELLALLIQRLGHRVYTAEDGVSGVAEALAHQPDVLLVDIGLPGLDGYSVAQQVRRALGGSVYLIALTGYGQPEDRRRALEAGFDAHFSKPLDVRAFEQLLRSQPLAAAVAH